MDKDFLKGIKFSLGIISVFLFLGLVFAGTHYASQLLGGTFNGNYDFQTGSVIDFTNATVLGLDGLGSGGGGSVFNSLGYEDINITVELENSLKNCTDFETDVLNLFDHDNSTYLHCFDNYKQGAAQHTSSSEAVEVIIDLGQKEFGFFHLDGYSTFGKYSVNYGYEPTYYASGKLGVSYSTDGISYTSNGKDVSSAGYATPISRGYDVTDVFEARYIKITVLGGSFYYYDYQDNSEDVVVNAYLKNMAIYTFDSTGDSSSSSSLPSCSADEIIQFDGSDWVCADGSGIGSGGGGWTHDGTQVFSGASPTTWTDLDLSSVVGSQKALVMLRLEKDGVTTMSYAFKNKGDEGGYYLGANKGSLYPGSGSGALQDPSSTNHALSYAILETDENGMVEWITGVTQTVDITVVGHISSSSSVTIGGETRKLMHVQDQKTSGTSGGTGSVGWNLRDLNTIVTNEVTGASLSSNQVTIPAGDYYFDVKVPIYANGPDYATKLTFSDGQVLNGLQGHSGANSQIYSFIQGKMSFDETVTFNVTQYISYVVSGGLGIAASQGTEVYTDVQIWKIEEGEGASTAVPYMPNYISGLEYAQDATDADHDITIETGYARDQANSANLDLATALTKQLDATWAAGDNAGGLFAGSIAADTIYHIFLIKNPTTGVVDVGFDTDEDAANRPSGYTKYRWLGYVMTDSSSNIKYFIMKDNEIWWHNPSDMIAQTGITSTAWLDVSAGINAFLPSMDKVDGVLLGAQLTSVGAYNAGLYSIDGTHKIAAVAAYPTANNFWRGGDTAQDAIFIPYEGELYYKVTSGTQSVLLNAVKIKR